MRRIVQKTRVSKKKKILEEDRKVRYLRGLVDSAVLKIMNNPMRRDEALELVTRIRLEAAEIFPDKISTFDLIYGNRFKRVIDEYCRE